MCTKKFKTIPNHYFAMQLAISNIMFYEKQKYIKQRKKPLIFSCKNSIAMATPHGVLQKLSPVMPFLHQIVHARSHRQVHRLLSCLSKGRLILILEVIQKVHKWKWILPHPIKQRLGRYKSSVKTLSFSSLKRGSKTSLLTNLQARTGCVKAFIRALLDSPLGSLLHQKS